MKEETPAPDWFRRLIATGVARMGGIRYAPLDTMAETESVWAETIWSVIGPLPHSEIVTTRCAHIFRELLATSREFPQIPDFTDGWTERVERDRVAERGNTVKLPAPPRDEAKIAAARANFLKVATGGENTRDSVAALAAKAIQKTMEAGDDGA